MQERANKQATLHDVAKLANVSHQTVSRVINHSPNVAEETRQRVVSAISELNYRPNRAARSLITGRSQTIQVIVFEESYLFPVPAIVAAAAEQGYRVGLSILRHDSAQDELGELFDDMTSRLVDGFLLFDPQESYGAAVLKRLCRGIPFVQIGGNPVENITAVVLDHGDGMSQMMDLLLGLGHRRIVEISGSLRIYDARIRHECYLQKMLEAGLEPAPVFEGDFGAEKAHQLALDILNQGIEFTALVCANDESALGAMRALHSRGLRVPEDVSVTGFDDHPLVCFYEPPLTTIRQDYAEMSRIGMNALVDLIQDPGRPPEQVKLKPHLIVRQSTRSISI